MDGKQDPLPSPPPRQVDTNEQEDDDDEEEDVDYVPEGEEAVVSEESDEGEDEDLEDDQATRPSKRKSIGDEQPQDTKQVKLNDEEEKKRAQDLWAMFNEGEDIKPEPLVTPSLPSLSSHQQVKSESKEVPILSEQKPESIPILDTSSSSSTPSISSPSPTVTPSAPQPKKQGLAGLVSRLGDKKKESTLLKSKSEWEKFKQDQGLVEELNEHTKSKDSYVEKQAFLSRTDVRQFEQERSIRDKMRSKKLP